MKDSDSRQRGSDVCVHVCKMALLTEPSCLSVRLSPPLTRSGSVTALQDCAPSLNGTSLGSPSDSSCPLQRFPLGLLAGPSAPRKAYLVIMSCLSVQLEL